MYALRSQSALGHVFSQAHSIPSHDTLSLPRMRRFAPGHTLGYRLFMFMHVVVTMLLHAICMTLKLAWCVRVPEKRAYCTEEIERRALSSLERLPVPRTLFNVPHVWRLKI